MSRTLDRERMLDQRRRLHTQPAADQAAAATPAPEAPQVLPVAVAPVGRRWSARPTVTFSLALAFMVYGGLRLPLTAPPTSPTEPAAATVPPEPPQQPAGVAIPLPMPGSINQAEPAARALPLQAVFLRLTAASPVSLPPHELAAWPTPEAPREPAPPETAEALPGPVEEASAPPEPAAPAEQAAASTDPDVREAARALDLMDTAVARAAKMVSTDGTPPEAASQH